MIKDDFLTLTAQKFINTYFTSRNFDQVKNMFAPEGSWLGASNNGTIKSDGDLKKSL